MKNFRVAIFRDIQASLMARVFRSKRHSPFFAGAARWISFGQSLVQRQERLLLFSWQFRWPLLFLLDNLVTIVKPPRSQKWRFRLGYARMKIQETRMQIVTLGASEFLRLCSNEKEISLSLSLSLSGNSGFL